MAFSSVLGEGPTKHWREQNTIIVKHGYVSNITNVDKYQMGEASQ